MNYKMSRVFTAMVFLSMNASARSEEASTAIPPSTRRVQGLFLPPSEIGCADRKAICEDPCKQWANGQPNFQYSYDRCVQICPKPPASCR
jgi:hypothetical protein